MDNEIHKIRVGWTQPIKYKYKHPPYLVHYTCIFIYVMYIYLDYLARESLVLFLDDQESRLTWIQDSCKHCKVIIL